MVMTAEQAYPHMPNWDQRVQQTFEPGDLVEIGPGYQAGGTYAPDQVCGLHTVLRPLLGGPDYYLAKGDVRHDMMDSNWDVICHATRLVPVHTQSRKVATIAARKEETENAG